MRFGFGTVLWGRRIDDLDYCLDVIAACGYQGVEFAQHHRQIYVHERGEGERIRRLRDIDELLEKLRERNLSLVGLVGGTLDQRRDFLKTYRECYLYLDRWPAPEKDHEFHEQVQRCLEAGITLALHPHWLTQMSKAQFVVNTIIEIKTPLVRLLLDTAHAAIAEDDPVEIVRNHHEKLCGVHLKNWKPDFGRWSHRYAHGFCLPGDDGIVDVAAVVDELHAQSYQGWLVLEQDHFVHRRERTALDGARWMESCGAKWGIHITPNAAWVADRMDKEKKNPFLQAVVPEKLASLSRKLERCVEHQPTGLAFYREVTFELRFLLNVEAVKIWVHNPLTEEFCLLGWSIGWNPNSTHKFNKLLKSSQPLIASIMHHPRICDRNLTADLVKRNFDDKSWLKDLEVQGVNWMTVLPLFNTSNPHQLRFLITIFSKERVLTRPLPIADLTTTLVLAANDPNLAQIIPSVGLERYGSVIAHWSDYLTDKLCTAAGGATNHLCGKFKGKVTDFANELIDHVKKRLQCNCVTVFLEDATGKFLEPVGRSILSLEWTHQTSGDGTFDLHYEDPGDKGRLTWRAWKNCEMVFSSDAKDGKAREKRPPQDDGRDEILFAPLTRRKGKCLGVVRLHNKILPPEFIDRVASMFSDEDAAQLDAIVQASLPHLELLRHREEEMEGLTRMVHEFQSPLVAIRAAVGEMRKDLRRKGHDPEKFFRQDFLGMVKNWADLMGHLASNAQVFAAGIATLPPQPRKTFLRSGVVLPVLHQIRPSLKSGLQLDFNYYGFENIPSLWIDPWQFQGVFFNLVTNACKYGASGEIIQVDIAAEEKDDGYYLTISDWGEGIPEEIREKVFFPKFRSKGAMLSDVSGQGLGLYVVRSIIEAHGGTIRVSNSRLPTTFEIFLPLELRDAPMTRRI